MNNDQLDGLLSKLKSNLAEANPRDPISVDLVLEQRLLQSQRKISMKRRRMKLAAALAVVFFLGGAGFVAAGGEAMLMPKPKDATQSAPPREGPILRHIHQFLRHIHDHFHIPSPHQNDGD
jgi:hypothetical protein